MRRIALSLLAAAACTNQPFTLDVPLRVVATSPSGGATGVARKAADGSPAPLSISFSEALDPATVTPSAVTLVSIARDGTQTAVATSAPTYAVASDGRFLVTVVPSAKLAYSQQYQLSVATSVKRMRDHGRLPTTVRALFTTEDPPALGIVFAKPSDGAVSVDGPNAETERSPLFRVRFTEPVDCTSVNALNVVLTETFDPHPHTAAAARAVPGTWRCNSPAPSNPNALEGTDCLKDTSADDPASECVITFLPTQAVPVFAWSSAASLSLKGGAASAKPLQSYRATAAGGQLPVTAVESSTLVDPPALSLTGSSPAAGAQGVLRGAGIALQFSEPVDCAQLEKVARIEEVRDPHPHIPSPSASQLESGTTKTRLLWPGGGGSWSCPSLANVSPTDHSCGPSAARCLVTFTPAADTNNPAEGADAKPLEYSSQVVVTLPGGNYSSAALLSARGAVESARATSRGGALPATMAFSFRTEDPPALHLATAAPGVGASNVPLQATSVQFGFDQPIDCFELAAASVAPVSVTETFDTYVALRLKASSGTPPGATGGCASAQFTWTAAAAYGAWQYSSMVDVTLAAGAYGSTTIESAIATTRSGQLVVGSNTDAFQIVDPPALTLVAWAPSPGATGIDPAAPLTLTFSRALKPGSSLSGAELAVVQAHVMLVNGGTNPGGPVSASSAQVDATNTMYTFQPSVALHKSAVVTATVTAPWGVTGVLASDYTSRGGWLVVGPANSASPPAQTTQSISFRVRDPDPLAIAWTQPNGGGSAAPGANLVVAFSRAVNCGTATQPPGSMSTILTATSVSATDTTSATNYWSAPSTSSSPVTCVTGNDATGAVGKAVLDIANPLALPRALDAVTVSIPKAIAANDATIVGNTAYGVLPADASFSYQVSFAPLGVASSSPALGSTTPVSPGSSIRLTFTAPMTASSFIACTTPPSGTGAGTPAGCNWMLVDTSSNATAAGSVATASGNATDTTIVFTPTSPMVGGDAYALTVYGGLYVAGGTTAVRLASANGTSYLPANFVLGFVVGKGIVVTSTSPKNNAINVAPGAPVCISFAGPVDTTTLTNDYAHVQAIFTSTQGTIVLPWSGVTLAGAGYPANTYCLNLTQESLLACLGGNRTLLYGSTVTVRVNTGVLLTGGNPSPDNLPYSASFKTIATPPQVGSVQYSNGFVPLTALAGASDVPLDAAFSVTLAASGLTWDATSASAAGNVTLLQGATAVPVTVTVNSAGTTLVVTPTPVAGVSPLLFAKPYVLTLAGGSSGILLDGGSAPAWLDSSFAVSFQTSRQTQSLVGPFISSITAAMAVPVTFTRNSALQTIGTKSFAATVTNYNVTPAAAQSMPGYAGTFAANPASVVFDAMPTWPNSVSNETAQVLFNSPGGAAMGLDEVGNPILGNAGYAPAVNGVYDFESGVGTWTGGFPNVPSFSAQHPSFPSTLNAAALAAPPNSASLPSAAIALSTSATNGVLGGQPFVIGFSTVSNIQAMQPQSFSSATISVAVTGGASCPLAVGTLVPVAIKFVPGCALTGTSTSPTPCPSPVGSATVPSLTSSHVATQGYDQVVFYPDSTGTSAGRILNACTYVLDLKWSQFANLYGLTGASGDLTFPLAGLTATPQLANGTATSPGSAPVALTTSSTATLASGNSSLSFNLTATVGSVTGAADSLAPETVNAANVKGSVIAGTGTFPQGSFSVKGSTVTFTLAQNQYFDVGSTYQVSFGTGVTDLAGNPITAASYSFTAPTDTPAIVAANVGYVQQSAAYPNGAFKLKFSLPMQPASFQDPLESYNSSTGTTSIAPGTIEVTYASGTELLGCISQDAVDPTVFYFQPTGPTGAVIQANTTYTVTVHAGTTNPTTPLDWSGNSLGAPLTTTVAVTTP